MPFANIRPARLRGREQGASSGIICSPDEWQFRQSVRAKPVDRVSEKSTVSGAQMAAVRALAVVRLMKVRRRGARRKRLGILHTASEPHAPSCSGSIRAFMRAAAGQGVDELDGLLIRDLTSPRNHTYDFARAAEARGIPVLDDARSIVRCSDKVFLHHELTKAGLPTPRGVILTAADAVAAAIDALVLPLVLKLPEGAFSKGVYRVVSRAEAETKLFELMRRAPAVVAQEYLPTAFDWRIGVLAGEPLFACRYHMAPGHWQIVDHRHEAPCEGAVEPLALADAPVEAVALALEACKPSLSNREGFVRCHPW